MLASKQSCAMPINKLTLHFLPKRLRADGLNGSTVNRGLLRSHQEIAATHDRFAGQRQRGLNCIECAHSEPECFKHPEGWRL